MKNTAKTTIAAAPTRRWVTKPPRSSRSAALRQPPLRSGSRKAALHSPNTKPRTNDPKLTQNSHNEWIKNRGHARVAYRKSIKRPLTLASAPAAFKKALEVGVPAAIKGFETSMTNGWQAAFPTSPTTPQKPDHRAEKRSREYPENIVIPDFI